MWTLESENATTCGNRDLFRRGWFRVGAFPRQSDFAIEGDLNSQRRDFFVAPHGTVALRG